MRQAINIPAAAAIHAAGGTQRALAEILQCTPQAVSLWRGGNLPPLRAFQLRTLRPRWFARGGRLHGLLG